MRASFTPSKGLLLSTYCLSTPSLRSPGFYLQFKSGVGVMVTCFNLSWAAFWKACFEVEAWPTQGSLGKSKVTAGVWCMDYTLDLTAVLSLLVTPFEQALLLKDIRCPILDSIGVAASCLPVGRPCTDILSSSSSSTFLASKSRPFWELGPAGGSSYAGLSTRDPASGCTKGEPTAAVVLTAALGCTCWIPKTWLATSFACDFLSEWLVFEWNSFCYG